MKCSIFILVFFFVLNSSSESPSLNENFYLTENKDESLVDRIQRRKSNNPATIFTQTSTSSPINSAIEMIDLVTKLTTQTNEVYKAASKLATQNGIVATDPVTFISSIIIYGAIKTISYLVSMFIYVSSLIAPWQIDPNAKLSFIDLESLHNIDYEVISNSVRSVPERSFKLLDIREEECKSRAMCEIGQHIHSYWPRVATYIRLAVEQLNIASDDNNTMSILRGLGWADCEQTFRQSQCPRSPFRKFYQIITSLSKLLNSSSNNSE